jgi:hypothetical protein
MKTTNVFRVVLRVEVEQYQTTLAEAQSIGVQLVNELQRQLSRRKIRWANPGGITELDSVPGKDWEGGDG